MAAVTSDYKLVVSQTNGGSFSHSSGSRGVSRRAAPHELSRRDGPSPPPAPGSHRRSLAGGHISPKSASVVKWPLPPLLCGSHVPLYFSSEDTCDAFRAGVIRDDLCLRILNLIAFAKSLFPCKVILTGSWGARPNLRGPFFSPPQPGDNPEVRTVPPHPPMASLVKGHRARVRVARDGAAWSGFLRRWRQSRVTPSSRAATCHTWLPAA